MVVQSPILNPNRPVANGGIIIVLEVSILIRGNARGEYLLICSLRPEAIRSE